MAELRGLLCPAVEGLLARVARPAAEAKAREAAWQTDWTGSEIEVRRASFHRLHFRVTVTVPRLLFYPVRSTQGGWCALTPRVPKATADISKWNSSACAGLGMGAEGGARPGAHASVLT